MNYFLRSETAQRLRFCVSFAELLDNLHRGQLVLQGQGGELEHAELLLSKMVSILGDLEAGAARGGGGQQVWWHINFFDFYTPHTNKNYRL
jgi:hypothetical protein